MTDSTFSRAKKDRIGRALVSNYLSVRAQQSGLKSGHSSTLSVCEYKRPLIKNIRAQFWINSMMIVISTVPFFYEQNIFERLKQ